MYQICGSNVLIILICPPNDVILFAIKQYNKQARQLLNRTCVYYFEPVANSWWDYFYCDLIKCLYYLISAADGLTTDFELNA